MDNLVVSSLHPVPSSLVDGIILILLTLPFVAIALIPTVFNILKLFRK